MKRGGKRKLAHEGGRLCKSDSGEEDGWVVNLFME